MAINLRNLSLSLSTGPRFLLCGQRGFVPGNPLASAVPISLAETATVADATAILRQSSEELVGAAEDPGLVQLAAYAWNGVFTSRIDPKFPQLFEESWRRVVATSKPQLGRSARSASELLVRMLFGGVNLPFDESPPHDTITLSEARARSREILEALAAKYITPRGVLIIDYLAAADWLSTEDIFNCVGKLHSSQSYLFSADDALRKDPFIRALVSRNLLAVDSGPAIDAFEELASSGSITFDKSSMRSQVSRVIPIGNHFADMRIDVWNQIVGSVRPIDTELLAPAPIASAAVEYQRFRDTLGASEGVPPWRSTASGWKIKRDFEKALHQRVLEGVGERTQRPIVVSGQTATGKSMACCQLALDIARTGSYPVIHHARRGQRPLLDSIDRFSLWAEENGATGILLVWDGMVDNREYYELNRQLRARGRRVQIVGTSYRQSTHDRDTIEAKAYLSKDEIEAIRLLLSKFNIDVDAALRLTDHRDQNLGASFLALLYRALPESEPSLRRGLALEMRAAEADFERAASQKTWNPSQTLGSLATALADAGYEINLSSPSERPNDELIDVEFNDRSTAERITALILVAGRRGLQIPLELILRIIGRAGVEQIVDLVKGYDIFRWTEDDDFNQFIGSRTTLEAELLAREEISIDLEIDILSEFIYEAAVEVDKNWGGREVQFIVDLLERIGPQGESRRPYERHYNRLAEAFAERRRNGATPHARFALIEANLRREYTKWASIKSVGDTDSRIANLLEAQQLLGEALSQEDVPGRARMNLLVELASAIGSQIHELTSGAEAIPQSTLSDLLNRVVDCALNARTIDPESIYPVDVIAWTSMRAVQRQVLDRHDALDILATADASMGSLAAESLSPREKAKYHSRRAQLAELMNNEVGVDENLAVLRASSDPAAYYFLAMRDLRADSESARSAYQRLLKAPVEIRADWRCAHVLFDLFWKVKSDRSFMGGERVALPFDRSDWQDCIVMTETIADTVEFERHRVDYAKAIALFHLERYKESAAVFRRLDPGSSSLSRRIVSTYVVSDPEGSPRVFTGRVISASADGRRGTLWVDQLATEVRFIPQRFSPTEYRREGDVLPSFHIAFNMRGALADPIRDMRR